MGRMGGWEDGRIGGMGRIGRIGRIGGMGQEGRRAGGQEMKVNYLTAGHDQPRLQR
jgi:hypothetical protein